MGLNQTWDSEGNLIHEEFVPDDPKEVRQFTRESNLTQGIAVLRQWADEAAMTTVTQGNAVAVLNNVVTRLGIFFDRFADLLENQFGEQEET